MAHKRFPMAFLPKVATRREIERVLAENPEVVLE